MSLFISHSFGYNNGTVAIFLNTLIYFFEKCRFIKINFGKQDNVWRIPGLFRSQATGVYMGETVPVMHACGHDTHVAILMGVAEALADMRDELPGTVMFLFQPAEEGAPPGEEGGAELMLKEGAFEGLRPDVVFGLHISSDLNVGEINYRPGPLLASVQDFRIVLKGKQTHGASPWGGIDPIVTGSQIVMGLQTIVSRNLKMALRGNIGKL